MDKNDGSQMDGLQMDTATQELFEQIKKDFPSSTEGNNIDAIIGSAQ